jgi:hypothetical protein
MAAKEVAVPEPVKMDDGRTVEFPGKRKLQKDSFIEADGTVKVRLDFRSGETRLFTLPPALMGKFAAHGAEQKLGDQIAGLKGKDGGEADIEDCVFAIDELMERLEKGEWATTTPGNGMAGMSVLAQALVKHTGQTIDKIKVFLAGKTHAEKIALRSNPKIKVIVEQLEAEKAARATKAAPAVDTDAMLAGLVEAPTA